MRWMAISGMVVASGLGVTCATAPGALAQVETPLRGAGPHALGIPPVTGAPSGDGRPDSTSSTGPIGGGAARTGKVKPPGSPLGEKSGTDAALERREREIDRRIRTGICRGC